MSEPVLFVVESRTRYLKGVWRPWARWSQFIRRRHAEAEIARHQETWPISRGFELEHRIVPYDRRRAR